MQQGHPQQRRPESLPKPDNVPDRPTPRLSPTFSLHPPSLEAQEAASPSPPWLTRHQQTRNQPRPVQRTAETNRNQLLPTLSSFEELRAADRRLNVFTPSLRSSQVPEPALYPRMNPYPPQMTHPGLYSPNPLQRLAPQTHNTPPVALDDLPPSSEPSAVPFFWQLPSNLERKALPPVPKVQRTCLVCMDKLDEDLFPYKCTRCSAYSYCRECLKSWFLDACRNESKMPPKCCSVIPVSSVTDFLTMDQIELFKAKYEEWSTTERLYCPVNTCSTFISPRLYVKPSSTAKVTDDHVLCPNCGTSVCTRCHSLTHIDDCPKTDLDPALEEQLKKWKIKRCPKCRTGVRKVFGCSHVECRCGAHFCWECLLPIGQCEGGCEDDSENDAIASELAEDDLDGQAGFHEDDEHDFGPEPYGPSVDAWGCHHIWISSNAELESDHFECQICYRPTRPSPQESSEKDHDGDTLMLDGTTWQCAGAHTICPTCPRPPTPMGDRSMASYTCWCGASYCPICDRNEKIKELEMAYECRCGMRICGACKEQMER